MGAFVERPDVQASLLAASNSPARDELGPYLSFVLERLPEGWRNPRESACPPYEGIGRIHIELVSAGAHPEACIGALCELLFASQRDARSWVEFAPCVVKRGAMRDDALRLKSTLESLGARVELKGFTWSVEEAPAPGGVEAPVSAKNPWWKFW